MARALLDGDLQFPEQFTPEKIQDLEVHALIDKITLYADHELDKEANLWGGPVYIEIYMDDGTVYARKNLYVHGYGPTVQEIMKTVDDLENIRDIGILMDLL